MYQYTISQWLLFFFWYCFLGWIWESCYVSVGEAIKTGEKKWINRGFLRGPALPIYGSAAIVILLATIPVKENVIHIFVFGALAATLMELVTGSTMEKLFHVKYWDYSNMPLNFQGHICFFVSLFWGFLSVLLVRVLHVPVERLLLAWPKLLCEIVAIVLLVVFVWDFNESFREAWDMRELLEKLTKYKDTIQKWEHRFDAVIAFTPIPDIDFFSRTSKRYLRIRKHLQRNPKAISKKYAEALKEIKGLFEDKKKS